MIQFCARGARILAVVVLAAVAGPGMSVVCISSNGHYAIESTFAHCRGAVSSARSGVPQSSHPVITSYCGDCTDVPLLLDGFHGDAPKTVQLRLSLSAAPEHEAAGYASSQVLESFALPLRC